MEHREREREGEKINVMINGDQEGGGLRSTCPACAGLGAESWMSCSTCDSTGTIGPTAAHPAPATEDAIRAAEARALREAAGEARRMARWDREMSMRSAALSEKHCYADGRLQDLEAVLRNRADRIERGE